MHMQLVLLKFLCHIHYNLQQFVNLQISLDYCEQIDNIKYIK